MIFIAGSTKERLSENIRANRNLYILNGVIFMILGLIALFTPLMAAEFLFILIGAVLFTTGVCQAIVSFASKRHWSFYITALLAIVAGLLLIFQPQSGIYFFGMVVAVFLVLQGCMQLFYAGVYAPFRGWGWLLTSGILSIALAIFIYVGWPISAVWLFGFLIALNLLTFGFALLTLALYANQ